MIYNKLLQLVRGKAQLETDCSLYRDKVAELEATLFQSKDTAKTSLDSLSKRLLETTQDLNTSHIDKQRLEARVAGLQDRLSQQEQMADTRAQSANSEATQLQISIGNFEALIIEYKSRIDELKRENMTLQNELTRKDGNLEILRDEQRNSVELEKIRSQTKVAEMEPLPELIREKDSHILGLREKVKSLEDLLSKQTLTITDFSEREKGHLTLNDNTRERLFHVSGENKVFQDRVSELERRVIECDQQNRDLINISSKKEEALQRVQTRLEEVTNENINLSRQYESRRTESRRQVEQMREKLSSRDRALQSNVADLEAQVAQLGVTNSQLKRNKDDAERR
ncbi:Outer dense fiber protein 2 isoform X3 [Oopsacas minuta]|uniref:Outer dense fiber protein 2 isoform X3 n=1 Tax=Oopsacas minuta TaxID=111878 RepID=A0AAV7K5X1_9METZ|nr:Outer dense fiber protein 2 isoform X3 [Oopsacas minuta]